MCYIRMDTMEIYVKLWRSLRVMRHYHYCYCEEWTGFTCGRALSLFHFWGKTAYLRGLKLDAIEYELNELNHNWRVKTRLIDETLPEELTCVTGHRAGRIDLLVAIWFWVGNGTCTLTNLRNSFGISGTKCPCIYTVAFSPWLTGSGMQRSRLEWGWFFARSVEIQAAVLEALVRNTQEDCMMVSVMVSYIRQCIFFVVTCVPWSRRSKLLSKTCILVGCIWNGEAIGCMGCTCEGVGRFLNNHLTFTARE